MLLVVAVVGKSAQVPFHTWLPDAMPGPTPISALIHAATMVAAGVFLVARTYPLFLSAPIALTLLALVAAVTMLLAALYALFTDDLKRVLAWSTVSQLAYMFGALAAGAWSAAVLHLLAHGAFKALLFLAAGSVIHAVGGATSMDAMGGLRDKLPRHVRDDDARLRGAGRRRTPRRVLHQGRHHPRGLRAGGARPPGLALGGLAAARLDGA